MKPFLILQLRPETEASDDEFNAILQKSGLKPSDAVRIRLDQDDLPIGLNLDDFSGVIVGGGPGCISDPHEKKSPTEARIETSVLSLMPQITARDFPFLGCCYGIGILGYHLGSEISKTRYAEKVGASDCRLTSDGKSDKICANMPDTFHAFVGHKEALQHLPEGCVHLVSSPTCLYQMIRFGDNVYATQFHPEADDAGFETRIQIYKDQGYFPPEDAQNLIELCRSANVYAPELILKNFVKTYTRV